MAESNTSLMNDEEKNELLYSGLPGSPLNISISLVALCFLMVHRAVYKLLWRFPNRYINQIMYPATVFLVLQV